MYTLNMTVQKHPRVISALQLRNRFGSVLRKLDDAQESLVIEKRGVPKGVLLSIRDYVRLAAPEPEILTFLGEHSKRVGTDRLSSRQVDQIIKTARRQARKR